MSGETIQPEDLPESIIEVEHSGRTQIPRFHDAVKEFKKELIIRAFEETNDNYQEAAAKLGIHRNYLYRLVTNLKLKDRLKIK
jgi:transcriptional regulator of acetoin/glycerol metabolism